MTIDSIVEISWMASFSVKHCCPQDLIKHTAKATKAQADLRMALDKMLKVLQTLNDSLKAVGLKGYPVSVGA